ncbi:MAG: divergent polysaccharide deacetylase family protein [Campylobacteraceae bacterium]|nr:divergent polysaccharide deacetylase family protein [Campylobacteraceae bacterium]
MAKTTKKKVAKSSSAKATKRKPRQSKKSGTLKERLRSFKILLLITLCFSAGFLSYGVLDNIFSEEKIELTKIESKKEIKKDIKKEPAPIEEKTRTIKEEMISIDDLLSKKITESIEEKLLILEENLTLLPDEKVTLKEEENLTEEIAVFKQDESVLFKESYLFKDDFSLKDGVFKKGLIKGEKPKLAIIIDDVYKKSDLRNINSTNLKLTPSIFPPSKSTPNTQNLAKSAKFYMIHLPLEAQNYSDRLRALKTTDNYATMDKFIKDIRVKFPDARFVNNHTGSKFTADEKAMENLYIALERYGFIFVDSKTIASSKAKEAAKKSGHRYITRDVFLDNENSVRAVKTQLQKAVNIAKDRGYAIAIGHPKDATFKALKDSDEILKDVEVVYLKDIYEYY